MLVQVNWTNRSYDYVQDFMLDGLIEAGVVDRFLRSSGWVTVGEDPIRSSSTPRTYIGPERRSSLESGGCEVPADEPASQPASLPRLLAERRY